MDNMTSKFLTKITDTKQRRIKIDKSAWELENLKHGDIVEVTINKLKDSEEKAPETSQDDHGAIIREVGKAKRPLVYVPEELAGKKIKIIPVENSY